MVDPLATLAPMLAEPGDRIPIGPEWSHEVKWDGMRLLAHVEPDGVRLTSRNRNRVTSSFPELGDVGDLPAGTVLDLEAIAMVDGRPSFARLAHRIHADRPTAALLARVPVSAMVFDVLAWAGEPLLAAPWEQRRERLDRIAGGLPPSWQLSPTYPDGPGLHAITAEQGLEGVVSKRVDARYEPGRRTGAWLKFAHRRRTSVVIGGWTAERGSVDRLGAVLVGVPEAGTGRLTYLGRVGSGLAGRRGAGVRARLEELGRATSPFSDEVPDAHLVRWVRPSLVADVESLGVSEAGRLRQPSFQGLRPDLDPEGVTA